MDTCPVCAKPYGKRKRCYSCGSVERKTGTIRNCPVCLKEFYVPDWVARDVARNSGTYCSDACKYKAMRDRPTEPTIDDKIYHSAGYVLIWMPEHPRASRGRVFEHIVVLEKKIGRPIVVGEHCHHIDHDPANNDPDNLELLTPTEHQRISVEHGKQNRRTQKARLEEYRRLYGPLTPEPKGEDQ